MGERLPGSRGLEETPRLSNSRLALFVLYPFLILSCVGNGVVVIAYISAVSVHFPGTLALKGLDRDLENLTKIDEYGGVTRRTKL